MKLASLSIFALLSVGIAPVALGQSKNCDDPNLSEKEWRDCYRNQGRDDELPPTDDTDSIDAILNLPDFDPKSTLPPESRRQLLKMRAKAIADLRTGKPVTYDPSTAAQQDSQIAADEQAAWDIILTDLQNSGGAQSQPTSTGANKVMVAGQGPSSAPSAFGGGTNASAEDIMKQILAQQGQTGGGAGGSQPSGQSGGQGQSGGTGGQGQKGASGGGGQGSSGQSGSQSGAGQQASAQQGSNSASAPSAQGSQSSASDFMTGAGAGGQPGQQGSQGSQSAQSGQAGGQPGQQGSQGAQSAQSGQAGGQPGQQGSQGSQSAQSGQAGGQSAQSGSQQSAFDFLKIAQGAQQDQPNAQDSGQPATPTSEQIPATGTQQRNPQQASASPQGSQAGGSPGQPSTDPANATQSGGPPMTPQTPPPGQSGADSQLPAPRTPMESAQPDTPANSAVTDAPAQSTAPVLPSAVPTAPDSSASGSTETPANNSGRSPPSENAPEMTGSSVWGDSSKGNRADSLRDIVKK